MIHSIYLALVACALSAHAVADTVSPYAGQEARDIKALSQQEVRDYLEGRGMGYAKAAELNHYPGPRHVLDMAGELGLSAEQVERTEAIFADMKSRAVLLGRRIVDKEAELDRRFAKGSIDPGSLDALLSDIAALQSEVRQVHLAAHREQRVILTRHQVYRYDQLRGYGSSGGGAHDHAH